MTPGQRLRIADIVGLKGESLSWKMDMIETVVEEVEDSLASRLDALENAMGDLYPGWRLRQSHAPSYCCTACDIGC